MTDKQADKLGVVLFAVVYFIFVLAQMAGLIVIALGVMNGDLVRIVSGVFGAVFFGWLANENSKAVMKAIQEYKAKYGGEGETQ